MTRFIAKSLAAAAILAVAVSPSEAFRKKRFAERGMMEGYEVWAANNDTFCTGWVTESRTMMLNLGPFGWSVEYEDDDWLVDDLPQDRPATAVVTIGDDSWSSRVGFGGHGIYWRDVPLRFIRALREGSSIEFEVGGEEFEEEPIPEAKWVVDTIEECWDSIR